MPLLILASPQRSYYLNSHYSSAADEGHSAGWKLLHFIYFHRYLRTPAMSTDRGYCAVGISKAGSTLKKGNKVWRRNLELWNNHAQMSVCVFINDFSIWALLYCSHRQKCDPFSIFLPLWWANCRVVYACK